MSHTTPENRVTEVNDLSYLLKPMSSHRGPTRGTQPLLPSTGAGDGGGVIIFIVIVGIPFVFVFTSWLVACLGL